MARHDRITVIVDTGEALTMIARRAGGDLHVETAGAQLVVSERAGRTNIVTIRRMAVELEHIVAVVADRDTDATIR